MPTIKQKPKWVDEEEIELDTIFQEASNEQESNALQYLTAGVVLGCVMGLALDKYGSILQDNINESDLVKDNDYLAILDINLDNISTVSPSELGYFFTEEEKANLTNLGNEIKSDWLASDPKTVENKAWSDQQTIMDKVGMYGNGTATRQGQLEVYQRLESEGFKALIPWKTAGDGGVCEECEDYELNSPYTPEEYPEPPHYGCRCEPGEPIVYQITYDPYTGEEILTEM